MKGKSTLEQFPFDRHIIRKYSFKENHNKYMSNYEGKKSVNSQNAFLSCVYYRRKCRAKSKLLKNSY